MMLDTELSNGMVDCFLRFYFYYMFATDVINLIILAEIVFWILIHLVDVVNNSLETEGVVISYMDVVMVEIRSEAQIFVAKTIETKVSGFVGIRIIEVISREEMEIIATRTI